MVHELRHQPAKGIYLAYELVSTLFFRLPFWAIVSIPKSLRSRRSKSWTWKREMWVRILRRGGLVTERCDQLSTFGDHLTVTKGADIKHVWVQPTPELITDEVKGWMTAARVDAASIPGYWMEKKGMDIGIGAPPKPGEKVVYSMHGGGYAYFSASPKDVTANILHGLLEHCDTVQRTFAIEYRLSKAHPDPPAHGFPAALLDALAGYVYLTNVVGFAPADIVMEGDSAGGGLALALTRYLVENAGMAGLPAPPGALLLLSPWVDLTRSDVRPGTSKYTNECTDYIGGPEHAGTEYARGALFGALGPEAALIRFVSPASVDERFPALSYKGFPRTFVVAGEAEILLTQIKVLAERMMGDMGEGEADGQVTYYESPDSMHDYLILLFHEPERTQTLKAIAKWLHE